MPITWTGPSPTKASDGTNTRQRSRSHIATSITSPAPTNHEPRIRAVSGVRGHDHRVDRRAREQEHRPADECRDPTRRRPDPQVRLGRPRFASRRVRARHPSLEEPEHQQPDRLGRVRADPHPELEAGDGVGTVEVRTEHVEMDQRGDQDEGHERPRSRHDGPRAHPGALRPAEQRQDHSGEVEGAQHDRRDRRVDRPGEVPVGALGQQGQLDEVERDERRSHEQHHTDARVDGPDLGAPHLLGQPPGRIFVPSGVSITSRPIACSRSRISSLFA